MTTDAASCYYITAGINSRLSHNRCSTLINSGPCPRYQVTAVTTDGIWSCGYLSPMMDVVPIIFT